MTVKKTSVSRTANFSVFRASRRASRSVRVHHLASPHLQSKANKSQSKESANNNTQEIHSTTAYDYYERMGNGELLASLFLVEREIK